MAMLQALKKTFPSSQVKGCNFHFNQCIYRKIQELGLVKDYTENEEVRTYIRMIAALAHIPPQCIDYGYDHLMANVPAAEGIVEFNNYVTEQWFNNPHVGYMWNCYNERHRTTNIVETWHSCLNKSIRKSHPNIVELIIKLKEDAKFYDLKRMQLRLNMQGNKRQKKYIDLDKRIERITTDLLQGRKSLANCLLALAHRVKL